MAKPSSRSRVGFSPSQAQATNAPQIGAVALKTDISAALNTSAAVVNNRKGNAEFSVPTTAMWRQFARSAGS